MNSPRIKMLSWVLMAVTVMAALAWLAGLGIESPAEAAARTAPPTPSPILVPVEKRVLGSSIVTRGTARFGLPQPVTVAPSSLKPAAGLVTTLPTPNTQVAEGDVLLTASGRPVFVLQGDAPAYRDLVPGLNGSDVLQLEQALLRLGFDPGPTDGVYDKRTSAAVAQWYTSKKWEPFGPTREQQVALRALEREEGDARKAAIAAATDYKAELTSEQTDLVQSERARVEHANIAAEAELAALIADEALISLDPGQPETARIAARAKVDLARAAVRKTRLDGIASVQAAEQAAMQLDAKKKIAALEHRLAKARAEQLASDLASARRKLGVQVPLDEVVFLPLLPVRVEELKAQVGATATGTLLTVTDNQLSIDSALPLDVAPLVESGMPVKIDEQSLGVEATGVVHNVASTPGTRGVDGFHIYMEVRVDPTSVHLDGYSVRLTIPIKSTEGAVTAVPMSALSLAADGSSRVQVQDKGTLKYVVVQPGLSADGFVEVNPVNDTLVPGQMVVVGFNEPTTEEVNAGEKM